MTTRMMSVTCALLLAAAGCTTDGDGDGGAASPAGSSATTGVTVDAGPQGPDGAPGCRPASPVAPYGGGGSPEVRATGHGIRAWGLMFASGYPPLRTDRELKIVWRVTGSGPFQVSVTGPDGRDRPVVWGPEEHGGSSYQRSGDEWGVGYRLDEPGCWRLRLARDTGTADVWLRIAA